MSRPVLALALFFIIAGYGHLPERWLGWFSLLVGLLAISGAVIFIGSHWLW